MNRPTPFGILSMVLFLQFFGGQNFLRAQVFYPDDPIWEDPDRLDVPIPEPMIHSEFYDFYENTFLSPGKEHRGPAQNVNTLGEVPNSSWYTNRHYWNPMSLEDLKRGPDQSEGPAMDEKWQIIKGKGQGISPGFTIIDSRGDLYLIKFDPPANPEMSTGAEIISTKFFYALGYHTPENYLVRFKQDQFVLSPEATTTTASGKEIPLQPYMVELMLGRAHLDPGGSFRAVASKFLKGKPLGPFRYYGTQPDDANDIFPHESRRELRGLWVFSAWLNHDDSRSVNTLDMLVQSAEGHHYVRHYLIDFGSTLGSGSVAPQSYRGGHEYILEFKPIIRSFFSLGFWIRPWAKIEYPHYPSIGRIEANYFDPKSWKTEYPNPAFTNCDAGDAFWAAKQVMNFTDEEIRAIVSLANYSNKEAENYLVEVLIRRRDKIGEAYLRFSGGLDKFRIEDDQYLTFEDLPAKYQLEPAGKVRPIRWQVFDNERDEFGEVLQEYQSAALKIPLPASTSDYLAAIIDTPGLGTVEVFIRNRQGHFKVVGLRRK